ncbi:MAG: PhzF family phenazine biosynthesis protein [Chitinophagaceae bacterium]
MKLKLYQIDAFTDRLFGGNPAAVVPLKEWIPVELMQQLAMENNLSETVFFVPSVKKGVDYDIRWFTPAVEINLCGHATLAAAYTLFDILEEKKKTITFSSKSGLLKVQKKKDRLEMDFPSWNPEKTDTYPDGLKEALGVKEIVGVYRNRDLLVELESEDDVTAAHPDLTALKKTGEKIIITAPGREVDFVSRFFAPSAGVDEDPVTGSAHSQLIPFWSNKLGKAVMQAKQLSQRGGHLWVEQRGDRVTMAGKCVFYMKGEVRINKQ